MAITSLNQGFELDTIQQNPGHDLDKALFESVVPGEIPTLKQDTAAIGVVHKDDQLNTVKTAAHGDHSGNFATTLEELSKNIDALAGRHDDIEYLRQDIVAHRGMNQQLALESEELVPGFLNNQRPLGYFTQLITKTQYTASLEYLADTKTTVMQSIAAALHELLERIATWYKDYRKEQASADAALDVRRMYIVSENTSDIARVLDEQYKLFNTQELDSQLAGRLGQRKEGSEDWYQFHMERVRTRDSSMKKSINGRHSILKLFHHQEQFSHLNTYINEAAALQNQLVGMINSNAEGRVVALLEGDTFTRIQNFIVELHQGLMQPVETLEDFRPEDAVKLVAKLFSVLVKIQASADDRQAILERMSKAAERAKVDFAGTQHSSDGLTKLKDSQVVLAKLMKFEMDLEAAMRALISIIQERVVGYRKELESLFERASKASGDTASMSDVLDYQLVKRMAGKFDALNGRYSAENEELSMEGYTSAIFGALKDLFKKKPKKRTDEELTADSLEFHKLEKLKLQIKATYLDQKPEVTEGDLAAGPIVPFLFGPNQMCTADQVGKYVAEVLMAVSPYLMKCQHNYEKVGEDCAKVFLAFNQSTITEASYAMLNRDLDAAMKRHPGPGAPPIVGSLKNLQFDKFKTFPAEDEMRFNEWNFYGLKMDEVNPQLKVRLADERLGKLTAEELPQVVKTLLDVVDFLLKYDSYELGEEYRQNREEKSSYNWDYGHPVTNAVEVFAEKHDKHGDAFGSMVSAGDQERCLSRSMQYECQYAIGNIALALDRWITGSIKKV